MKNRTVFKNNDICDTDVNGFILHPLRLGFKFPS